ncbi:microtubule-associated protein [Scheffersomyces xylosifermentans]|uniref:microtubule-associated protein n=1 Tax=Scheffersomyces xylosifermentans TaxID=1304137 RepID=UPI00315D7F4B
MIYPKPMIATSTNAEYDTGVSNGDVDWLFRGKSKKLTKKLNTTTSSGNANTNEITIDKKTSNSSNKGQEDQESKDKTATSEAAPKNPTPAKIQTNTNGSNSSGRSPRGPISPSNPTVGTSFPSTSASSSQQQHPTEKASKLDKFKFGRSRSTSSPDVPNPTAADLLQKQQNSQPQHIPPSSQQSATPKRRSSLGFISPSLTSDLAANDDFELISSSQPTSGSPQTSHSPLASNPLSTVSSNSNTTGNTTGSPAASSAAINVPSPKLNPNLLGSANNAGNYQDLVSVKRRTSLGTKLNVFSGNSINSGGGDNPGNTVGRRRSSLGASTTSSSNRVILNKNPNREKIPLKELSGVKLRRLIPSRRPKKGNVLIPQDLIAPPPRLSQGISLNDGNKPSDLQQHSYTEKEIAMAVEAQRRALFEAEKHAHEAHLSAKRIAAEVSLYKNQRHRSSSAFSIVTGGMNLGSNHDEDEDVGDLSHDVENIEIDKPLHVHEKHFADESLAKTVEELSLETIYTRCCHLREILPIPATLKQLKNKSKPLQVLKLLNPKPTLIDVLSFSDFIAITPINTVIFDNVTMTTEMLKHFLASLVYNTSLEKLSLRNVAIDEVGWKLLCKFLSRNTSIKKLDISQQRVKADTKPNCIRSAMNWDLLIRSLVLRGGIEEFVMNGCKLTDETFKDLIENAIKISTYRLGIASVELNLFKAKVVADWFTATNSKCVGVDLAFNDLSHGQLKPFIEALNKGVGNLMFFSLNSTHLTDVDETTELIKALSKVRTLRFLDLSSLPDLFPAIISRLSKYLPQFENLRRIHFDLNELTPQSIGVIAQFLPQMKSLVHVSLLGNRNLNISSAGTLYNAVKSSNSIFTLDVDYDLRIAFYLMRNMDRTMKPELASTTNHTNDNEEDLMFDGSLLMQTAEKLLMENESQKPDPHKKKEDLKIQRIITNALIERTRAIRKDIHEAIDTLFTKRNQGTLPLEGKETLLRFCLLDSSLEKLVHMFEEQAQSDGELGADQLSRSPSVANLNLIDEKSGEISRAATPINDDGNFSIPAIKIAAVHDTLHERLDQAFEPHQVVTEATSDGVDVPIDNLTGRPVLMRSVSQTSVHAKEQEKEEGEFHRFGFFMEQRSNSESQTASRNNASHSEGSSNSKTPSSPSSKRDIPLLNALPSGPELRDAIIAAKGIESVTDLIDRINKDEKINIEKIFSSATMAEKKQEDIKSARRESKAKEDSDSIDSSVDPKDTGSSVKSDNTVDAVVDEVYEKLLNDAQRARSIKQGSGEREKDGSG